MTRYKDLFNNSILFSIGIIGTKALNIFLIPLYTNLLTTTEYGRIDIIISLSTFILPIVTLELGQSALRFSLDNTFDFSNNQVGSFLIKFSIFISIFLVLVSPLINIWRVSFSYILLFILLLIVKLWFFNISLYVKGLGLIKQFTIAGVLEALFMIISNLFLIVMFKMGVEGYILGMIIGYAIAILYLFFVIKDNVELNIRLTNEDHKIFQHMIAFSSPIVLNSLLTWVISSSAPFFILKYLDASSNGLYAIANRVPVIISMLGVIFNQAWQISSFKEFESEDKVDYYSMIFNSYAGFLFLMTSVILLFLRPLIEMTVHSTFVFAWKIAPFLLLGMVFNCLALFIGTFYSTYKNTIGIFKTAFISGIISIILNILLIQSLGLIGSGVTSSISFFILFLLRLISIQSFTKLKINKKVLIFSIIIVIIQIFSILIFNNLQSFLIGFFLLTLLLKVNLSLVNNIVNMILSMIRK